MGESSSKAASSTHTTPSICNISKVSIQNVRKNQVSHTNSTQTTTMLPEPDLSEPQLPNSEMKSTINPCGKLNKKVKLTLQDYRKQVGIKVLNQKPNQKLGIVATSEAHAKESEKLLVNQILCPHCGYLTCSTNKCQRCMRVFEKGKLISLPSNLELLPENKCSGLSTNISRDGCYGNRRPRVQRTQSSRQVRGKYEEPQCVTLSSDEDDNAQQIKKLKAEDALTTNVLTDQSQTDTVIPASHGNNINPTCSRMEVQDGDITKEDLLRWKDGGLSGPFFAVNCRCVRIGSYKISPSERVLFSSEGIMLDAPKVSSHSDVSPSKPERIHISILARQLLQVEVNFNRQIPVIFLYVTPLVSRRFSSLLGLRKSGPYWDSASIEESQKRLTLLPCNIDDSAKNAIKQAFVPKGVFREISNGEANRLLVISSPPDVREALDRLPDSTQVSAETSSFFTPPREHVKRESHCKSETRITRATTKSSIRNVLPVVPMFSWSDGPDRFSVTTEDYCCLNQDNLLNDSIIDFYVRYVFSTKLDESLKQKCHVFSSFFYQRLTTRPTKINGRKHPIEDDPSLTLKEKRHSRVKSWTKKVDIFAKDYLIIPINERGHWFLAIICFPGLPGPVSFQNNLPVKLHPSQQITKRAPGRGKCNLASSAGESFYIGSTTITPVNIGSKMVKSCGITLSVDSDKDEADTDEEESNVAQCSNLHENVPDISEPIKQPCILFFDSLVGSSHHRVAATLREYLAVEYEVRRQNSMKNCEDEQEAKDTTKLFCKNTMISACLDVPQQNNSYDCGVYVLQFAESFMVKPFVDYNLQKLNLSSWFPSHIAGRKRKNLQFLLIRLTKEINPVADSILELLPKEDVRLALQDRPRCKARNVSGVGEKDIENTTSVVPDNKSDTGDFSVESLSESVSNPAMNCENLANVDFHK